MKLKTAASAALIAVLSTPAYSLPQRSIQQVQPRTIQQGQYRLRQQVPRVQPRIQNDTSKIRDQVVALPHPDGCPRTAFCGCGAAKDLGIEDDKSLWSASAWLKFPRSSPAPNTAAVAAHHVFVLKRDMGNGNWLVADYNSGGHLSRLHVRGLAGFTIVNPLPRLKSWWRSFTA